MGDFTARAAAPASKHSLARAEPFDRDNGGQLAHFAARRKRDWAIRVALGLRGSLVVRHILGQGTALVAIGIAIGAVGTVLLGRLLVSFLFNVSTIDPIAFLAASGALLIIGAAAAFIPAWRAGTVDPALVLRDS